VHPFREKLEVMNQLLHVPFIRSAEAERPCGHWKSPGRGSFEANLCTA
jgi:hypothetical protein